MKKLGVDNKSLQLSPRMPFGSVHAVLNSMRCWVDAADASALLSILKAYPAEEMNYKSGMRPHSF
jgi:hypothetical protein